MLTGYKMTSTVLDDSILEAMNNNLLKILIQISFRFYHSGS